MSKHICIISYDFVRVVPFWFHFWFIGSFIFFQMYCIIFYWCCYRRQLCCTIKFNRCSCRIRILYATNKILITARHCKFKLYRIQNVLDLPTSRRLSGRGRGVIGIAWECLRGFCLHPRAGVVDPIVYRVANHDVVKTLETANSHLFSLTHVLCAFI